MKNEKLQLKIQKFKNLFHLFEAVVANIYYRFPSRKLKVIGVTGTDGKTTTVHLIYHILKSCGKKVSMVSTIYAKVGKEEFDTGLHTTTPNSFLVQKLLKIAVDHGDEYFILETTSHALDQNRVFGINFLVGVLTNVTHEHLDYHQSYEEYVKTKAKLFCSSKIAVLNEDDASYNSIVSVIKNLKFKIKNYNLKLKITKTILNLTKFNQYNYSAAYTVCKILGLFDQSIFKAMKSFKLPKGRVDVVYDKDFKVIIDFAHTPNAIDNVLRAVSEKYLKKEGRLIHVFGSAGLRDATKRPLMGKASAKHANVIILTEEDYRTENVNEIMEQIERGMSNKFEVRGSRFEVYKIQDRQRAINKAVSLAKRGDVVILTGKGHERSLCRGRVEHSWDEYKAVKKALKLKLEDEIA
jgi:UDP-N-acetylmuramoyl-L-alanyl-D-glutamate--2,6-diaminopimelate ligase